MSPLNTIALLGNGLTLALALGFLLIVLWQDFHKDLNQFFAIFLVMVTLWNSGSLLIQAILLIDATLPLAGFAVSLMEIGFTGSSVAIYVLTTALVGIYSRRLRALALTSFSVILLYRLFLIVSNTTANYSISNGILTYRYLSLSFLFYLIFDGVTLYIAWRYRRKIRAVGLRLGIVLFVLSQSMGFLNPELQFIFFATTLSSIGALLLSFTVLRLEIITPLASRISQMESMHRVSLAVTSQIAIDTVLNEIATQAARWLEADGAGIFLKQEQELELATVYNLPRHFIHTRIPIGEGVVGTVAANHQSLHLEHYSRNWAGMPDLPLAKETFGSVICVPLTYSSDVIGVLLVIAGVQGRLFEQSDVYLLELLAAQAAVAITHSRLFAEQHALTQDVESARSQLETVLVSTENPVIAVNRQLVLIFANPAAKKLFNIPEQSEQKRVIDILPIAALPEFNRNVLRHLRRKRTYIYEIELESRVYLCHLASLGGRRTDGWVAVLNDVTELKELDRLKSEMVRWASHDLKNPLTGAMLHLDLLAEDVAHSEDAEIHHGIAVIGKQLDRMNRIIRGILDLERLKAGGSNIELCRPTAIIENTVDEVEQLAADKRIALHTTVHGNAEGFWGDPSQFERALINIVENAVKFTPIGGDIWIEARSENGDTVFEVRDTGIGIPEQLHEQIFNRFFRGGQSGQQGAEHVSGSGLGLSFVKTIVENHKGRVWLKSQEGVGTTFFVGVPIADMNENNDFRIVSKKSEV